MNAKTDDKKEIFGTQTRVGGSRTIAKDGKVTVNKVQPPTKQRRAEVVTKDKQDAD